MERPLFGSHLLEAVQRQVDALAKADSGGPDEQECIGVEIIGSAQLPLQELILLRGKRSGKIARWCGEIFSANEIGRCRGWPLAVRSSSNRRRQMR